VSGKNTKYHGFFISEMVMALTILGVLSIGLAISLYDLGRFNHYQLMRQRCVSAAQAELDSLMVTGQAISNEEFSRLWPGLDVAIEESEGAGQWQGMVLVKVTTGGKSLRREVKVQMSRYIFKPEPAGEGGQ
jgi:hypothetical protein